MNKINIKIPIVRIVTIVLLYSSIANADFKVNIGQQLVYKHCGVYVIGDLGVGESAYIRRGMICIDKASVIKIPKDSEVVTKRSEYGSYFKVKRLPNDKIAVELIPAKSDSKHDETVDFLKRTVDKQNTMKCTLLYSLFGYSENEMLSVATVEGATSLKELLDKTKP